jgi:succinyl-diaminopimelate desuccinylase
VSVLAHEVAQLLDVVEDDFVAGLATELIAIPGHEDLPQREADVAVYVDQVLRRQGLASELVEVEPGRPNVIARLAGTESGPTLMLNAHLDTVPGYGMDRAYEPRWDAGRLWGRGAVDMKGALACMIGAARALRRSGRRLVGELVLTGVVGEESGSQGAEHLVQHGAHADFAIVGEPTGMRIAVAHKGGMWIEVRLEGRPAHGSVPELGVNAIDHAARFVTAVSTRLRPQLDQRIHPRLGHATVNVGVIRGGDRPPMVPAWCVVQLDRRWLPDETHGGVLDEFRRLLRQLEMEIPDLRWTVEEMPGTSRFIHYYLECPEDTMGLPELRGAIETMTDRAAELVGVQFWTDAALLAHQGCTPAVVCGPGDIAQAHSHEEFVEAEQLSLATRCYLLAAAAFLSGSDASG